MSHMPIAEAVEKATKRSPSESAQGSPKSKKVWTRWLASAELRWGYSLLVCPRCEHRPGAGISSETQLRPANSPKISAVLGPGKNGVARCGNGRHLSFGSPENDVLGVAKMSHMPIAEAVEKATKRSPSESAQGSPKSKKVWTRWLASAELRWGYSLLVCPRCEHRPGADISSEAQLRPANSPKISAVLGPGKNGVARCSNGRHLSVGSPENDVLGLLQESRK